MAAASTIIADTISKPWFLGSKVLLTSHFPNDLITKYVATVSDTISINDEQHLILSDSFMKINEDPMEYQERQIIIAFSDIYDIYFLKKNFVEKTKITKSARARTLHKRRMLLKLFGFTNDQIDEYLQ